MARPYTVLALAAAVCALVLAEGAAAATPAAPGTCPPAAAGAPPAAPGAPPAAAAAAKIRAPASALVVCVAATAISGKTFDHWAFVAERGGDRHPTRHRLLGEVLGFLIASYWTIGEAAAQGVTVTEAQVSRRFDTIRHQQFPHRGEFARFLRSSGETVGDLLFRVRLNMLSQGLQHKVLAAAGSKKEQEQALVEFIKGFKARWQSQTYCAPRFAVADCGHIQAL